MTILGPKTGALLLTALVAGCASPAMRYYTLDPVPATSTSTGAIATPGPTLRLGAVTLPAVLDRVQIVRRAGQDRIDIAELDRWAGPLDDLMRRALARDLALRLPDRTVLTTDEPAPAGDKRALTVSVTEFDGDLAGHVVLEARWTLFAGSPAAPVAQRQERITVEADDGAPSSVAGAMSQAIGILADRIAAAQ
jgi:uncharacterized lipoprotein YmbA